MIRDRRHRSRTFVILAVGVAFAAAAGVPVTAAAAAPRPAAVGASPHPAGRALHPAGGALFRNLHIAPRPTRKAPTTTGALTATSLPVSVDLSAFDMPVGDQGQVDSCVAWAVNYAQMGWYSSRLGRPTSFAPMYVYSQIHVNGSVGGGGAYPSDAYALAGAQGVDTQSDYAQGNYDFADLPTAAERANAAHHKAGAFSYLYSGIPGPAADGVIESALASGNPVAITIPIYSAFDDLDAAHHRLDATTVDTSTYRGDHEVLVVGYDATGVRIENQWGTGWGDQGYANLDWNFIEQYSYEATVLTGLVTPTPARTAPAIPTAVRAVQINTTQATLSWAPPASNGGSTVTGYTVGHDRGRGWSTTLPATARSMTFTITPGATYTLSVSAVNAVGTGPTAGVVVAMRTALPGVPRTFTVVVDAGRHSATATWAPPASTSGYPVTGYRVARDGVDSNGTGAWATTVAATARSMTFTNLVAGRTYTLTVAAITSQGTGPSASGRAAMP